MIEVGLCASFQRKMGEVPVIRIVRNEAGLVLAQLVYKDASKGGFAGAGSARDAEDKRFFHKMCAQSVKDEYLWLRFEFYSLI